MTSDEIDEAEIEDLISDCAEGWHQWGPEHLTRAEKTCTICKITLDDKQIALIRPKPRTSHIRTRYEDMAHGPGGMAGTSIVYENGHPLEHTRREVLVSYDQYANLRKLGVA